MRKGLYVILLAAVCLLLQSKLTAQQTSIKDYVIFGGNGSCPSSTQTTPLSPGCSVLLGAGTSVISGKLGSYRLVKTTGSVTVTADIFSGGTVELAAANTIDGKIAIANSAKLAGTVFQLGTGGTIKGNVDVNGNTTNAGSTIQGSLTHPAGTTYSGPVPKGGNITGTPTLPGLPLMPAITNFPAAGTVNITGTTSIVPGAYGKVSLTGNKTLTFSGTGNYIFNSIKNAGAVNTFIFDFQGNTTGYIKLFVHGDVDLNRSNVQIINGGNAARVYAETHGNGSTSENGNSAWFIANGSGSSNVQISAWAGTVWAPYAGIYVGNQTSTSRIRGALWSGTQVNLVGGVIIENHPFEAVSSGNIFPYYSPDDKFKVNEPIGSELRSLYYNQSTAGNSSNVYLLSSDSVWIEVIAIQGQRNQLATLLMGPPYGLTDTIGNGKNNLIITGKYHIPKLLLLNDLPSMISYVRPVFSPVSNSGIIQTPGDSAIRTNFVRNGFGVGGDSIRIGVISDSYNTLPNKPAFRDIANDDLPGRPGNLVNRDSVRVLKEYPLGVKSDEGRAMLQIIHDVAPKAKLSFRTGFLTSGDFAQGIRELAADSCKVIVDDVTFITEPFYKPGIVEQAIQEVSALGVNYVTAAGNFGEKSYESLFNPAAAPAGLTGKAHNFGGGDILQSDSVKGTPLSPGTYTIVLQWEDDIYSLGGSLTGTKNDLDIYLADDQGIPLFGFNRNNIGGDPIEILPFTVTANTTTNILVVNASAPANATTSNIRFKYVVFRGDLKINEYQQGSSTIVGQGNSNEAITVGAALYTNTPAFGVAVPTSASFSSTGGTSVNNAVRNKPDLVGPNGVNTTVDFNSLDLEKDNLPNFYGTSAAAPHVAAAVALVMEAHKKYYKTYPTPAATKALLQSTAIDMNTPGFDFKTGWGFLQVDAAVRSFANPKPAITKLEWTDSSLTPGVQQMQLRVMGNYLSANSKVIFGTDTLVTTFVNNSLAVATVPAFSSNKTIYLYTAPKSPSMLDGGLSNGVEITGVAKKNISVIANNKTKKFGEQLPVFTFTVLVDGDSLQKTSYTLEKLGLTQVTFQTEATANSNVGIYYIRPVRTFDSNNPSDNLLLESYNYAFVDGALQISKLPLTIKVRDTTLLYGERIAGFRFNYSLDPTATISDPGALINNISTIHASTTETNVVGLVNAQAVTIVNGQAIPIVNGQAVTIVNGQAVTIVNGQAIPIVNAQAITIVNGQAIPIVNTLTSQQTDNLSFLATAPTLANTRTINTSLLINGTATPQTTTVVDLTQESIIKFNVNTAQTSLTSSVSAVHQRGLVDQQSLANGQAVTIVNGQAVTIVNAQAVTIVNGQAVTIVNGQAVTIVNGQAIPIVNGSSRLATIIDEDDIGMGQQLLKSLNVITGMTAGSHTILPASLLSDNLTITYQTGLLTVLPVAASVTAEDKVIAAGDTLPVFTSKITGFMPADTPTVSYSLSSPYLGAAGVYDIIPAVVPSNSLSNYLVTINKGKLYVNPKGNGAKKLRPYLDCVEEIVPTTSGLRYVAKFYCINDNATPVYVPVGTDNKISSAGRFDASAQPIIFMPGTTSFRVPFDGASLKWELRTFDSNKKTSTSSTASANSNRCSNTPIVSGTSGQASMVNEQAAIEKEESKILSIFPNPAQLNTTVNFGIDPVGKPIMLIDAHGRILPVKILRWISKTSAQIDLSGLSSGFYFIRIAGLSSRNGMIIKQ
jgi:hypothetical protein